MHRPDILLCDEATSALDPETTLSILRLLKDINRRFKITIVLITHEMSVIREICDQVLVLDGGRIAEIGPVWRVFGDPEHPATRALLEPLNRDIPADVAERLQPQPGLDASSAVVELTYMGKSGLEPDPLAIAKAFGGPFRLLQSSLDRIQGHVYGRLLTIGPAGLLRDVGAIRARRGSGKDTRLCPHRWLSGSGPPSSIRSPWSAHRSRSRWRSGFRSPCSLFLRRRAG